MKPLLFQHQFLRNLLTIQFINIHFNTRFSTALSPFNEATFVSTPRFAQLFMSTLINIKPYTIDKHCHTPDHTPGNAPILQPVSTSFHFDMFSIIRAYQNINEPLKKAHAHSGQLSKRTSRSLLLQNLLGSTRVSRCYIHDVTRASSKLAVRRGSHRQYCKYSRTCTWFTQLWNVTQARSSNSVFFNFTVYVYLSLSL